MVRFKTAVLSHPFIVVNWQDCAGTLVSKFAPFIVPSFPFTVKSKTVLPLPSSKFQYPTSPDSLPIGGQFINCSISDWFKALFHNCTSSRFPLKYSPNGFLVPIKRSFTLFILPTTCNESIICPSIYNRI